MFISMKKASYLNYYKTVLAGVSFDLELFKKEYYKALKVLSIHERASLNLWIRSTYSGLRIS